MLRLWQRQNVDQVFKVTHYRVSNGRLDIGYEPKTQSLSTDKRGKLSTLFTVNVRLHSSSLAISATRERMTDGTADPSEVAGLESDCHTSPYREGGSGCKSTTACI